MQTELAYLEPVSDAAKAELLLHPLRQQILTEARTASTAAEIARRIDHPPQKVNYHVRTLVDAGFLEPAGEGRKRNLIEKRYRASARSYVLLPEVLGDMSVGSVTEGDRFSASYLLHLSSRLQQEVAAWVGPDAEGDQRVPTLSVEAELRFTSAEQRAEFAEAVQAALADVIANHTAPARTNDGSRATGRPFRLMLGCYPIPEQIPEPTNEATHGG